MFVRQNKRVTLACVLERRRGIHKYISFNYHTLMKQANLGYMYKLCLVSLVLM